MADSSEMMTNGGGEEQAQEMRAREVRKLVGEGAQLLGAQRPGEAVAKLVAALELDPHSVPAAINLGGAYIMQGRFSLAVPVLEAAAQLEPDNAMIWSNLAAAYLGKLPLASQQSQDRAIAAYERALAADPKAPNVHYNLALIYLERRDTKHAAAYFHRALETDPNDRDARQHLKKLESGENDSPDR